MPEQNNSGLGIIGQFAQNMCIFCSSCQIVGPTGIFGSHPHVVGQVVVAYDDLREIALLVPCCIGLDQNGLGLFK